MNQRQYAMVPVNGSTSMMDWIFLFSILFCFFPCTVFAQAATLRINELMASNQTILMDKDGDSSDWIEIYNPTSQSIDLLNWSLTDNKGNPRKWLFPKIRIDAKAYLVVFASDKDKRTSGQELHTNFKLSSAGEYLALLNPDSITVCSFDPAFPEQLADVSYGYVDNDTISFTKPTPGELNQASDLQLLPAPVLSRGRGFYESEFSVEITSGLQRAQIYYTTDGSAPDQVTGTLYQSPIPIHTTTILRAVNIQSDEIASKVITQTYLFLEDVIRQPNNPPGYPSDWGPYTTINGKTIADYEMDPQITEDPDYADQMREALLSIPTLSIATDISHLFSHSTRRGDPNVGGIYIYTRPAGSVLGDDWERPVSTEFFSDVDSGEFQINCGLRVHGGESRRPEKSPKHSFRLCFRSQYGPARLQYPLFGDNAAASYDTLTLRAGFCNAWHHWDPSQRARAQYLRDTWAKDTQQAMGHVSGHGTFVHLYLNGLYWGVYNATERVDRKFAQSYLGGEDEDYDVFKDAEMVVDGDKIAWDKMVGMANAGLSSNTSYQRIQGNNPDGSPNPNYEPMLDVVNLIDYMILNLYAGNTDWDHHNWVALRNRVDPDKGFKFLSWDAEHILESVYHNMIGLNNHHCPSELFQKLRQNATFRDLFAQRAQLHCSNGGVLTPQSCQDRWMQRAREIELAIIAESARWGDYRRDVHRYKSSPYDLYTANDYWFVEQDFLMNTYFPARTAVFINQLRQADLYP